MKDALKFGIQISIFSTYSTAMSSRWTHRKRSKRPVEIDYGELGIELLQFAAAPTSIVRSQSVFDMDDAAARLALIKILWTGDFGPHVGASCAANEQLHSMLRVCVTNTYRPNDPESYERHRSYQLESTFNNLLRIQSQKQMPLITAAQSVMAERDQLGGPLWHAFAHGSPGTLASQHYTKTLINDARALRPPASEPLLTSISAVVFDNYTRRCLYKSQVSAGQGGYQLDMTNWGVIRIPARLAPNMDAVSDDIFANLYRTDLSLRQFVSAFNWHNPEIVTNKQQRFCDFIKASLAGQLFKRPDVTPQWVVEMEWEKPMWGVLQSSNAHVTFEMNTMRRSKRCKSTQVMIAGGDGLSVHRENHNIATDPETFLDMAPAVVPMLGEMPHGHHHILHATTRDFSPYIQLCAKEVDNPAIVADPAAVKYYNSHVYFSWVVTRASAEYIGEISRAPGGQDFEDVPAFLSASEQNIDLSWVVHYLYDAGFLVLQFKQFVRANKSTQLDLLWREFVTIARSSNKTMYGPLAILQVYRGAALHPELAKLWRQIRCLPMSRNAGACMGWDCPCEWLHDSITRHVQTHVTEKAIEDYILNKPFMDAAARGLRDLIGLDSTDAAKLKKMNSDVSKIKKMLYAKVGSNWVAASAVNSSSKLFPSGSAGRTSRPWRQYEKIHKQAGKDSTYEYVRRHLMTLAFRHEWRP